MNDAQKIEFGRRFRKESHRELHQGFNALKELKSKIEGIEIKLTPKALKSFPIDAPLLKKDVKKVIRFLSKVSEDMRGISYQILTFDTF